MLLPRQLFPPDEPAVRFPFENLAYIVIPGLLVAPAVGVVGRGGLSAWTLGWRPLRVIGVISYGVYLWHYPIIQALHDHGVGDSGTLGTVGLAVAGLGLASLAAGVGYVVVGRPALRLRESAGTRPRGPIARAAR